MANTSSRTLRLLSLLQTHRFWPGPELADRLGVSARTLRRDVDRLRELGYPVDAHRGAEGGYQLAAGAALPPLVVDDEEAVALAVGMQAVAQGAVPGVEEAGVRALTKVVQVMPPRLRRRVEALRAVTVPPTWNAGPRARPRRPHHARAGLPRRRAHRVRLHHLRGRPGDPPRRAAPARPARPPLVPRGLRPAPPRLAQLPPRPHRRAPPHRRPLPAPQAADRRRRPVRARGHPQHPGDLPGRGAGARPGRAPTPAAGPVGRDHRGGRGRPASCA